MDQKLFKTLTFNLSFEQDLSVGSKPRFRPRFRPDWDTGLMKSGHLTNEIGPPKLECSPMPKHLVIEVTLSVELKGITADRKRDVHPSCHPGLDTLLTKLTFSILPSTPNNLSRCRHIADKALVTPVYDSSWNLAHPILFVSSCIIPAWNQNLLIRNWVSPYQIPSCPCLLQRGRVRLYR